MMCCRCFMVSKQSMETSADLPHPKDLLSNIQDIVSAVNSKENTEMGKTSSYVWVLPAPHLGVNVQLFLDVVGLEPQFL